MILKQVEKIARLPTAFDFDDDDGETFTLDIGEDSDSDDASLAARSVETDVSLHSISSEELGEILRLP